MNKIEGQIVVGAPRSQARFFNAPSICDNCLTCEEGGHIQTDNHVGKIGTCYVCESITLIFKVMR